MKFVIAALVACSVLVTVSAYTEIVIDNNKIEAVKTKYLGAARKAAVHAMYSEDSAHVFDHYRMSQWSGKIHLSDDHQIMLFVDTKVVYMTQEVMLAANKATHAVGSVVKLYAMPGDAVNAIGAKEATGVQPAVSMRMIAYLDNQSTELLKKPLRETVQDCNRMACQVIGQIDGNPTVFVGGKYRQCSNPLYAAQRLFIDSIKNAPSENPTTAYKRWTDNMGQCPTPERAGTVPTDTGIDMAATRSIAWFARPMSGEAFYIHRVREAESEHALYPHHGAGVIATGPAAPGDGVYDALTLEQIVDYAAAAQMSMRWMPHMFYVPAANKKQEFKAKWLQTFQAKESLYWALAPTGALTVREVHGLGGDAQAGEFHANGHLLEHKCKLHNIKDLAIDLEHFGAEYSITFDTPIYATVGGAKKIVPALATAVAQIKETEDRGTIYVDFTCGPADHVALVRDYSGKGKNAAQFTHRLEFTKAPAAQFVYPKTCMNAYRYADALADQQKLKVGDWVKVRGLCTIAGGLQKMPKLVKKTADPDKEVPIVNESLVAGVDACQIVKTDAPAPPVVPAPRRGGIIGGQGQALRFLQPADATRRRIARAARRNNKAV